MVGLKSCRRSISFISFRNSWKIGKVNRGEDRSRPWSAETYFSARQNRHCVTATDAPCRRNGARTCDDRRGREGCITRADAPVAQMQIRERFNEPSIIDVDPSELSTAANRQQIGATTMTIGPIGPRPSPRGGPQTDISTLQNRPRFSRKCSSSLSPSAVETSVLLIDVTPCLFLACRE